MIYVTRGILIQDGCILGAQRPETMSLPLKWELPGGKFEAGESSTECLVRETFEELGLEISVQTALEPVDHYFKGKTFRMLPFICEVTGGDLTVFEHKQVCWIPFHKVFEFDWAPAEKILLMEWTMTLKESEFVAESAI